MFSAPNRLPESTSPVTGENELRVDWSLVIALFILLEVNNLCLWYEGIKRDFLTWKDYAR